METIEDILKELEIVIAKHPDQWIYDICRVKNPVLYHDKLKTIPTVKIEHMTLEHLAIRIAKASERMRCCLKQIHKLSEKSMMSSDPFKVGKALYKIFDKTRPFIKKN